ncbi:MAG: right-handed parallel beta-helix repeat-containing protein [Candidatus Cloacimonadota bacterium]|nr:right-handed parallel beta-helix repeat-containing protein [Candidatus Cloacimonadota bacterium]
MKKIFLILVMVYISTNISSLNADELHVGSGQQYPTISSAYNAAQAGDVIVIHPGYYYDHLDIEIDIDITGSTLDPNDVTIESDYYGYSPLHIDYATCNISNLTVCNACGCGISMFVATCNIVNCIAEDNEYCGIGSSDYSEVTIKDCIVRMNAWYGIFLDEPFPRRNGTIENTLVIDNGFGVGSGAGIYMAGGVISNCTIVENKKGVIRFQEQSPTIINSIAYGNQFMQISSYITDVTYSDIEGGFTGTGNIDADPLFVEEGNHLYHLLEGSPCIDAGDPNMQDPDSTRIDMGCYPTVYDVKKIKNKWNWVSFPRLERDGNEPVAADSVLMNIEPFPTLGWIELKGQGGVLKYYDETWHPVGLENIVSTSGYKLRTSYTDNSYLPLDGSRLAPDTPITLLGEPYWNWIGYWLPQTLMSDIAFGDEWSNVRYIKGEDHFYFDGSMEVKNRTATHPISSNPIPMRYGKGYMVQVHQTITDFQWNYSGEKISVPEKQNPQNFTYTDKPDYEAINIDEIDESIMEIGVFEDDICVGATVVDSGRAQIFSYTDFVNKDVGELTFQIVYGRGDKQKINDYSVYDFITGEYIERRLIAGRQGYSIVRLNTGGGITIPTEVSLSQNAPNPFGYNTTISYALPEEFVIEISIYNIRGQRVKALLKGKVSAGNHSIIWNGKDDNSKKLGNGIYFYKLSAGKKRIIKKMFLLR